MFDLKALSEIPWLAEPTRLRLALSFLASIPPADFPTRREVAVERRHRLDLARAAPQFAIPGAAVPDLDGRAPEPVAVAQAVRATGGKVGVIPVHGPIEQRTSCGGMLLGGCSTEEVGAALDALVADRSVGAVVLHLDTPGGGVPGVEELGDQIRAAAAKKPVYASADSMAASAGYWLASQAPHLSVTPGGEVGAVGVFLLHVDQTQANADQGLNVSVIRAGEYKAEGNPFEVLTAEGRDYLQSQVNYVYQKFLAAAARGRGTTPAVARTRFGQGRVLNADAALAAGMVDRVMTFHDLLGKLTGGNATAVKPPATATTASAEVLRRRHDLAVLRSGPLLAYPNEHACRVVPPEKFDRFRRVNHARKHKATGKWYDVIYGHNKETGAWEDQAYRYPKATWTADQARADCQKHDGSFEAASGDGKSSACASCKKEPS